MSTHIHLRLIIYNYLQDLCVHLATCYHSSNFESQLPDESTGFQVHKDRDELMGKPLIKKTVLDSSTGTYCINISIAYSHSYFSVSLSDIIYEIHDSIASYSAGWH